ncbi:hypothetical protein NDU88_003972 [Pleurodeles waltl]|uniref:Uncharacterized protein n=1 Tax=Pleurodeles waltl TaxID=8319 RepID=A0AAV7SHG9_PLEWA|nr:hypothetical protein NDU88_003972 [Pleurodeles waltl]
MARESIVIINKQRMCTHEQRIAVTAFGLHAASQDKHYGRGNPEGKPVSFRTRKEGRKKKGVAEVPKENGTCQPGHSL